MPDIVVSVGVFCTCGEHLCKQSAGGSTPNRKLPFITVTPCPKCLKEAKDIGNCEGYDEGLVGSLGDV